MKLPDITYGAVPDEVSPALQQEAGAARGLGQTVEQGLTQLGQAVVQKQTTDAHLEALEKLNNTVSALKSQKALPGSQLKAALGEDYEKIVPAEARAMAEKRIPVFNEDGTRALDPETGQPVDKEGEVPTFMVAGELFKRQAKQILDTSSQHITVGTGWQANFQRAAMGDVLERHAHLNDAMAEQARSYFQDETRKQALAYAHQDTGDGKLIGVANQLIDSRLPILGEQGKLDLKTQVLQIQQGKPIYGALSFFQSHPESPESIRQLKVAQEHLNDPASISTLDPRRVASLERGVRVALQEAEKWQDTKVAARAAMEAVGGATNDQGTVDVAKANDRVQALFKPGGPLEDKPQLWEQINTQVEKRIHITEQARKQKVDDWFGRVDQAYLNIDPASGQPQMDFTNITPDLRAEAALLGKDAEEHLRILAKWGRDANIAPTRPQEQRMLAIERSINSRPTEWRQKSLSEQMAIVTGKKPVPGFPDAPVTEIASRDWPHLREKLASNSVEPKVPQVQKPEEVADQTMHLRWPGLLHKKPLEWGRDAVKARGIVQDQLQVWLRNWKGDQPPGADDVRKFLENGPFKDTEVKRLFGLATQNVPEVQADVQNLDRTGAQPALNAKPAKQQPPTPGRPRRTANGETREWDATAKTWVLVNGGK